MGFDEKRKSTRVRNKALSILLCSSLILTSFSTVFASNGAVNSETFEAKDNLCTSLRITDTKQSYKTKLGDVKLDMSKGTDGKVSILTENIDESIVMKLPKEVDIKSVEKNSGGMIKYKTNENVTLEFHPLRIEENGVELIGTRTDVVIEDHSAPNTYSFKYNLPKGYKVVKSEEYYKDLMKIKTKEECGDIHKEDGWIYILNQYDEISMVIEPAKATDAMGKSMDTHYDVIGSTVMQTVEFDEGSHFPITVSPTATKPTNHKIGEDTASTTIDSSYITYASFAGDSVSAGLTLAAKTKVVQAIVAKLGSKFNPILAIASVVLSGYSVYMTANDYKYTKVDVFYEIWAIYKHQGGRWVEGRQYKNSKLTLKCMK